MILMTSNQEYSSSHVQKIKQVLDFKLTKIFQLSLCFIDGS